MHPKDFMERWKISRGELAMLLNKSIYTLDQWLAEKGKQAPPTDVQRRLDELNLIFLKWQLEDEHIPQIRQLYELIRDR